MYNKYFFEETLMFEESMSNFMLEDDNEKESYESPSKLKKFFETAIKWFKNIRNKIIEFGRMILNKIKEVYKKMMAKIKNRDFSLFKPKVRVVKIPRSYKWYTILFEAAEKATRLAEAQNNATNVIKEIENKITSRMENGRDLIDFEIKSGEDLKEIKNRATHLQEGISGLEDKVKKSLNFVNKAINVNENALKDEKLSSREMKVIKKQIKNATEATRILNIILNKAANGLIGDIKIYNSILGEK